MERNAREALRQCNNLFAAAIERERRKQRRFKKECKDA